VAHAQRRLSYPSTDRTAVGEPAVVAWSA